MANILTTIKKEIEKGNNFLDKKGNFVSMEKIEVSLKKSYLAGLKDGSIPFSWSFEDYKWNEIENSYTMGDVILKNLGSYFTEETPEFPEPKEAEETEESKEKVAN